MRANITLLAALLGGTLALGGCGGGGGATPADNANANPSPNPTCAADEESITDSTQRVLCVGFATEAVAPFSTGYWSPARVLHKITVKDVDGNPVDINNDGGVITAIAQSPVMYMTGMSHTTPQGAIDTSRAAEGIYTIPTYYVMASGAMGHWEITVQLTDGATTREATFLPTVDMVEATTGIFAMTGSNAADTWKPGMLRDYRVWLDAISTDAGSGRTLSVFVSTKDLMSGHTMFPAVYVGQTLHDASDVEWAIGTTAVEVCTDGGTTWQTLSEDGNGYYSISGLNGLTAGQVVNLPLKLTVNGLQMLPSSGNLQLSFTAP